MVMNNQGQIGSYAIMFMLAVVVVILGVSLAFPVNQMTTNAMNKTSVIGGMDCTNSSISDYTKAACWTADMGQAFFIGSLIAIAGAAIAARVLIQ
jgi:hypothetical protein